MNDENFEPFISTELRDFLPPLSEDEFKQLEEHVANDPDHTILPPVQIWGDLKRIVDGHHQYKIRKKLGLTIRYVEVCADAKSIYEVKIYMLKLQAGRRNMDAGQLATYAATAMRELEDYEQKKLPVGRPSSAAVAAGAKSIADTAKQLGVSKRILATANKVVDKGAPEVTNGVISGVFSVSDAETVVDLPQEKQVEILNKAIEEKTTLKTVRENGYQPKPRKPKSGREISPAKLRKEARLIFGKFVRTLDKMGLKDKCGDQLEWILDCINNAEEIADEKNLDLPF